MMRKYQVTRYMGHSAVQLTEAGAKAGIMVVAVIPATLLGYQMLKDTEIVARNIVERSNHLGSLDVTEEEIERGTIITQLGWREVVRVA